MTNGFDRKLPSTDVYLTSIPSRDRQFKMHDTLGRAKAAVSIAAQRLTVKARIYHLVDKNWVLLYDIEGDQPTSTIPWVKKNA